MSHSPSLVFSGKIRDGRSGTAALRRANQRLHLPEDRIDSASDPDHLIMPIALLRLEGLAALVLSIAAYATMDLGWLVFAILILAPDLTMLGYLAGPRIGALTYNMGHTYAGPALLAAIGWAGGPVELMPLALIWAAHIGLDRTLGYGLKNSTGFGDTHLGRLGRG